VHPLTASVPDVEVPRADVVAARLARKVGPLFGIAWEQSPFGCTWVCDFGAITLAEIARGAPYPVREIQSALDEEASLRGRGAAGGDSDVQADGPSPWRPAGRAVWTPRREPAPASIAHATLNRYGPDTKAAVVLTGANRLLQDVTAAIAGTCRWLADTDASAETRLAVWAGLVLEAFRGQPALVAAAIQARAIQRALTTPWGQHLWLHGLTGSARCEFGPMAGDGEPEKAHNAQQPTRFDLVDATLPLLRLPIPISDGPLLNQGEVLDDIASRWCRRLLQVGHPGRGITWVAEAAPGHRSVQSYVRVGSAIAPFVAEVLATLSIASDPGSRVRADEVAGLLADADLSTLPVLARRACTISAHILANYLRFHDGLLRERPQIRAATRLLCDRAATAAAHWLGPDDPASLLLGGYAAYLHAWDLGWSATTDQTRRATAAKDLARQLDRLTDAWRRQAADPGTVSYLLEIGVMALDRLSAPGLDADLPGLWRTAMRARDIDPDRDIDDPLALPAAHQYHLQNYAVFLAGQATSVVELRRALAAQRACAQVRDQVTRGELADYGAKFTSGRTSRQAAAAIAARLLLELHPAAEEAESEYRAVLAEGIDHARAAIGNPTTAAMLGVSADGQPRAQTDPEVVRLALAVLPVIVTALEHQRRADGAAVGLDEALLAEADRLLLAASGIAVEPGLAIQQADLDALANLRHRRSGIPERERVPGHQPG
jgi:hypothetical protein